MKDVPEILWQHLRGHRPSQIVMTAIELDLFSALKGGVTGAVAAKRTKTDPRAVAILLHALAALGPIRKRGETFSNTPLTREFLAEGGNHDSRLALGHYSHLLESWSHLTEVVRRGRPHPKHETPKGEEERTDRFIALMHHNASLRGPGVAAALDLRGVRNAIDLGGGSGGYSIALARRSPNLHVTMFDRPAVLVLARRYVREAGLLPRFGFQEGDLLMDAYGRNFDFALISSVAHMFSPEENIRVFRKVHRALNAGGHLVVHDFLLDDSRTSPPDATLFAVNMLVNTPGGNNYTFKDYREWIKRAGFKRVTLKRLSGPSHLIVGMK